MRQRKDLRSLLRYAVELCIVIILVILAVHSLRPTSVQDVSSFPFGEQMQYSGSMQNHYFEGKGLLQLRDGSTYQGEFENGYFSGKGIFCSADGWTFEGTFENGNPVESGILTTKDGIRWQWNEDGSLTNKEEKNESK